MLGRIVLKLSAVIALIIIGALWLAFFSARPPLTTDPATLAGDGSYAANFARFHVEQRPGLIIK